MILRLASVLVKSRLVKVISDTVAASYNAECIITMEFDDIEVS